MSAQQQHRVSKRGFVISLFGIGVLASHSGFPSPLSSLYGQGWGLSPTQLCVVFSIYVVGLLLALLTTGSLAQHIGRRPVIMGALALGTVAMAMDFTAQNLLMLVIARILQGVAAGLGLGSLGAAMQNYAPSWRQGHAAMLNGALPPLALGTGALVSGGIAHLSHGSEHLPYLLILVCFVVAFIASMFIHEVHPRRAGHWQSLRPSLRVPREIHGRFFTVLGAMSAGWGLTGFFLGIGPSLAYTLFHLESPAWSGLASFSMTATAAVAGFISFRGNHFKVVILGAIAIICGSALIASALWNENLFLYFAGSVIGGIGFGCGFQAGLRNIVDVVPHAQRRSTLSAVYVASYFMFGAPTLASGILLARLDLRTIALGYCALLTLLAICSLVAMASLQNKRQRNKNNSERLENR